MLTPEQIIEYATRLNSSNILVSESMLSEAIKPEDAVKISKANDKLLSMLDQIQKAFGGKIKSIDAEIASLLDGAKSASEVLKNADDIKSEKFVEKIKQLFDESPDAFMSSVLLLQSRAQELVEILKVSIPKIVKLMTKSGDKDGAVYEVLGSDPKVASASIFDLLKKSRPNIFKRMGNFFKRISSSTKIVDADKKVEYEKIADEISLMKASDLKAISSGIQTVQTDKGEDLADAVQKVSDSAKSKEGSEGEGSAPTAEETKKAEAEADPTSALKATADDSVSPKAGAQAALKKWYDGLSSSAQETIKRANRIGDLRDLIDMAVDDSAKAVEDQVAAAVQAWRDDHEEVLVKSKRFAKKNFEDLKTLMPQLVSAILKKKDERSGRMTQAEVNKFVATRLSKIFYRDKNVLSEMMNEKSTSKIREIVELTRILREMAESQVKDEKGNILIRPGLKVRHKKSGLEYTVRDVQDDKDKIKIVLNVPELPRVQPGKTLPSVVTEKDDPKSTDLPQISNDLDLEKISNEEQTIFVIDEKEFEKRYEVK